MSRLKEKKNRLVKQGFIIDENYGAKKIVKRGNKSNVDKEGTENQD